MEMDDLKVDLKGHGHRSKGVKVIRSIKRVFMSHCAILQGDPLQCEVSSSPPVHTEWWAHMHCFLSACPSIRLDVTRQKVLDNNFDVVLQYQYLIAPLRKGRWAHINVNVQSVKIWNFLEIIRWLIDKLLCAFLRALLFCLLFTVYVYADQLHVHF